METTGVIGVFGANGFIGRHLVRRLSEKGANVVAFGRHFPDQFYDEVGRNVQTRQIDITDDLGTHVLLQDITHVVQLINSSNPAMANKHLRSDLMLNVVPHVSFIQSCIQSGVRNFIFLSSGGTVYGIPQQKPIPESHPTKPLNSYGLGKLTVEHYLDMLSRGTELGYTILRVSNPFGPGQTNHKGQGLVPAVLERMASGVPVTVLGDGGTERDYIYIEDVIDAVVAALDREPLRDVINIGSGRGRTILEVVDAIEKASGRSVQRVFAEARPTDTPSNVLDVSKAREVLDWVPRTDFDEAIGLTVGSYRFDKENA